MEGRVVGFFGVVLLSEFSEGTHLERTWSWAKVQLRLGGSASYPRKRAYFLQREDWWRRWCLISYSIPLPHIFAVQTTTPLHPLWKPVHCPKPQLRIMPRTWRSFPTVALKYLLPYQHGHHYMISIRVSLFLVMV